MSVTLQVEGKSGKHAVCPDGVAHLASPALRSTRFDSPFANDVAGKFKFARKDHFSEVAVDFCDKHCTPSFAGSQRLGHQSRPPNLTSFLNMSHAMANNTLTGAGLKFGVQYGESDV